MNNSKDLARLNIMELRLRRLVGTLESILNGNCQLTTDPMLSDPAHGVWDIESNLLRLMLCEILGALDETIPPTDNYKGVRYYHVI